MEKRNLIYIYLFIAFVLSNIPLLHSIIKGNHQLSRIVHLVGMCFAMVNTMVHESCHALMAILTGGKIKGISLFTNTSGVAETTSNSRIAMILVSYAGYTGSSLASIGLFYLLYIGQYEWIIYFFIVLSAINLLWIRNIYGVVWLTSFSGIIIFFLYKNLVVLLIHTSIFLSCMVLVQSIVSAFEIMKLSVSSRKDAGDATNLAKFTFIPAVFWGILFLVQSIMATYFIISKYLLV